MMQSHPIQNVSSPGILAHEASAETHGIQGLLSSPFPHRHPLSNIYEGPTTCQALF